MNVIKINRLELEMDKIPEAFIQNAIIQLKNGHTVQIVDNVGIMGKIDSPARQEVIETFNGLSSVELFRSYVEKSKEAGRDSFSNFKP